MYRQWPIPYWRSYKGECQMMLCDAMNCMYHRGDFMVQFSHGAKSDVSVFHLLYNTATVMLTVSERLQEEKLKIAKRVYNVVYQRILWSKDFCVYHIHTNTHACTRTHTHTHTSIVVTIFIHLEV